MNLYDLRDGTDVCVPFEKLELPRLLIILLEVITSGNDFCINRSLDQI